MLVEVQNGKEQTVVPAAGDIVTGNCLLLFFSFKIFKGNQIYELHNFLFILARVTQINPRWARCAILCVKDIVLAEPFRGQLRKEDVRATEKDRVELYQCFRPNDIILARVVSFSKEIMLQF